MKQLFMALLLLTAATLLVPSLRERAAPHAGVAAGWAWSHMRGPMAPILNPFRKVKAKTDLSEVGRRLVQDRNRGRNPPEPEDFTRYISSNRLLPDTLDPWGTAYRMRLEPDSVALLSAGPDGILGTDDDVVFKVYFPRRERPRRLRF